MSHRPTRHYYALVCAGQRLCVPAEDVHYLAPLEDTYLLTDIPAMAFDGALYPVYSLRDGLRPAMGAQDGDTHCLVLKAAGADAPMGIALACRDVFKLRSDDPPQTLPTFMLPAYALVTGLLKREDQWLHLIGVERMVNFLEKVGFCDERASNAARLAG